MIPGAPQQPQKFGARSTNGLLITKCKIRTNARVKKACKASEKMKNASWEVYYILMLYVFKHFLQFYSQASNSHQTKTNRLVLNLEYNNLFFCSSRIDQFPITFRLWW